MKRILSSLFLATVCLAPMSAPVFAESPRQEAMQHPRIASAIREIEGAIQYMESAPHDFGGHKAAAIQASRAAVEQLRAALAYRAAVDTRHGR